MAQSVGIVVPAYRPDPERLTAYVERLRDRFPAATIRVELDCPGTTVVDRLAGLRATVSTAPSRRGKGAAITTGFEALDADVLAFADADGSITAADLGRIVDSVDDRAAALAVGSRRHPNATVLEAQRRLRAILGESFAWLARRLSTVWLYDYQCGAKVITADGWERVRTELYEAGFGWDVELVTMAGGRNLDVVEVPVTWTDRSASTVDTHRTIPQIARALLRSAVRARTSRRSRASQHTETLVERLANHE